MPLSDQQLASRAGIPTPVLAAIRHIESSGNPRAVRFETRLFRERTGQTIDGSSRAVFESAYRVNPRAAVESSSFGLYQVLGSALIRLYGSPAAGLAAFDANPRDVSDALLVEWFRAREAAREAANNGNYRELARLYNGSSTSPWYGRFMAALGQARPAAAAGGALMLGAALFAGWAYWRSTQRSGGGRGLRGLAYPPQPCGRSYEDFRGGWKYGDAYEQVAFRQDSKGTSQKAVLRSMRKLKQQEYERYVTDCDAQAAFEQEQPHARRRRSFGQNIDPDDPMNLFGLGRTEVQLVAEREVMPRAGARREFCEPVRVKLTRECERKVCRVEAVAETRTGRKLGYVAAETLEGRPYLTVGYASLVAGGETVQTEGQPYNYAGCGIGTRLYEAMASFACDEGLVLRSDRELTSHSRSFWEKQVAKGRAYPDGEHFVKGRLVPERYVLKQACKNTDLSGLKRRRRKRRA